MVKGIQFIAHFSVWNTISNAPFNEDPANLSMRLIKDGVSAPATNAPSAINTVTDPGAFKIILTAAEMNANSVSVLGTSTTEGVIVVPAHLAPNPSYPSEAEIAAIFGSSSAAAQASIAGEALTIRRGDLFVQAITGLGSLEDRTSLYVTFKTNKKKPDTQSTIQLREDGGLLYFNEEVASNAALGSVEVTDEATGDILITLYAAITSQLGIINGYYDVQYGDADGQPHTVRESTFAVRDDVTRQI